MDWKYKHFAHETFIEAPPEIVRQLARKFLTEALAGWKISDTAEGLEAKGLCALRKATAKFRIEPAPRGTRVAVTLLVARASARGLMLHDAGGAYDRQVHRWLEGMETYICYGPAAARPPQSAEQRKVAVGRSSPGTNLFMGCALIFVLFGFLMFGISAIIGLITGEFYIPGRGGHGLTLHGEWARISSGILLLYFGWVAVRFWKEKRQNRGSG
ncbi:MAG TPA: hypothetical protein VKV95_00570 [Terriglobia bacterium]|nr:hypothetical protein [Terriglobia bacterium]